MSRDLKSKKYQLFNLEEPKWVRLAAAPILSVTFSVTGTTNIMFQHDIMNGLFIGTALLILCGRMKVPSASEYVHGN